MRRAISVRLVSKDGSVTMIVPGELSFEELSTIIDNIFKVSGSDHVFISERSDERIGPNTFGNLSDECHRYLSAYPGYPIDYLTGCSEVIRMKISWTGDSERDCPYITESSFSAEWNDRLNSWLDDEYYLLAEVDGNPLNKRIIFRSELIEEVAEALKSDERLDFYLDIDNDCLAVLAEDHDEYDCITEDDVKNYDTLILIRKADDILLYKAVSDYSGTAVNDPGAYAEFLDCVENPDDWLDYLDCSVRREEREWVKKNDLWIDICDIDALFEDIRLF